MTQPENYDREKGSEEGVLQPDGSVTFPPRTIDVPGEETDEERAAREALLVQQGEAEAERQRIEQEQLAADQAAQEQALSEQAQADVPREQGTVVEQPVTDA